jgi:DNA helicase-2/ATP-dependent DNA helicase PcrA
LAVRDLIEGAGHDVFAHISKDAKYIRLLQKGTQLREALAEVWRRSGEYASARSIVSNAFQQEHFSASTRVWLGVNLMTIHKSKGKEFDEVVIFEGEHIGRLVRDDSDDSQLEQSRLTLRVGVTRARQRTLIMTPSWKSCRLL